jgi:Fe-S-cluster-containing dehydrogenase component
MDKARRSFLKGLATVGATSVAAAAPAVASEPAKAPPDAVGMLYDTTLCIGCKTCVIACQQANNLEPDNRQDPLYMAPLSLNDRTKNIIKLFKAEGRLSYMKQQCMHCIDPACVGACMIGAFQKREYGIVTWESSRCIGCRYCQVACPYNIPKFEWDDNAPKIIKCELCNHRLAEDKQPACCEVCPRAAVIFGKYTDLMAEAKKRLADHPDRYVNKIYGEHDGGGTQVLYLSHVPFEDLGLPVLSEEPVPKMSRELQHGIYKGFIAPAALYVILGGVAFRNRRKSKDESGEGGHE